MTPRQIILASLFALMLIDLAISFWGWMHLKAFLASHPSLSSPLDFDEFKRVVKTNMYLALAIIAVVGAGVLLIVVGFFVAEIWLPELIVVASVFGALCTFTGKKIGSLEAKMKAMPVDGNVSQQEYDRIVESWTKDPFPNW